MTKQSTSSGGEQQEVESSHSSRVDKDSLGEVFGVIEIRKCLHYRVESDLEGRSKLIPDIDSELITGC